MRDEYPRLCVEEKAPPAPLRFPREAERTDADRGEVTDSIAMAQDALERAQRALDGLDELVDETVIPFPGRDAGEDGPDDDGPRAA